MSGAIILVIIAAVVVVAWVTRIKLPTKQINRIEQAHEFRVKMLSLGIDQQWNKAEAEQWIDDHAKAITEGYMCLDPVENVLKCWVEGEAQERKIPLTVEGIAYYRMAGNRLRDPNIVLRRIY